MRIVGACWSLLGLILSAQSVWGLMVEDHFPSVVTSWLITLAYGVTALAGGYLALRAQARSRYVLVVASVLGLLYALVYVTFGGIGDASSYAPGVAVLTALAACTLFVSFRARVHAT